jgi:hypothetical protein
MYFPVFENIEYEQKIRYLSIQAQRAGEKGQTKDRSPLSKPIHNFQVLNQAILGDDIT